MAPVLKPPGLFNEDSAFGNPLDVLNQPAKMQAEDSEEEQARLTAEHDALTRKNLQLSWENAMLRKQSLSWQEDCDQQLPGMDSYQQDAWWPPANPWVPQAAEAGLCPGVTAMLHSLKQATELNGVSGVIEAWHAESGRWSLKLPNGEEKFAKPDNLAVVDDPVRDYYAMYCPSNYDAIWRGGGWCHTSSFGSDVSTATAGSMSSSPTISGDDEFDIVAAKDSIVRTTMMMRNIPNNYTREMLLNLLSKHGFSKSCDLVYLPIDFQTEVGLGYAFINMVSVEEVEKFRRRFHGFSDWGIASQKVCEVTWSNPLQGLQPHIDRYRNSPVMHETVPDSYRPVLFKDGKRIPFPVPTKRIRAPRLRRPSPKQ
jgi:hypothetical protein